MITSTLEKKIGLVLRRTTLEIEDLLKDTGTEFKVLFIPKTHINITEEELIIAIKKYCKLMMIIFEDLSNENAKSKPEKIISVRYKLLYFMKENLHLGPSTIAKIFNVHRTNFYNGYNVVKDLLEVDNKYIQEYKIFEYTFLQIINNEIVIKI